MKDAEISMSVIRKDGAYEEFPSNSKIGNWETLSFFNDEEAGK